MNTSNQGHTKLRKLRLLAPINAEPASRWSLEYAVQRQLAGNEVEVVLLNVGEIVDQWQVLRFRTQREIADFQAARAQTFIEQAQSALAGHEIVCRGLFKQGDIVFSILDTAEELECDEIVLPAAPGWRRGVFGGGVAATVQSRQRAIPVVLVGSDGRPSEPGQH